jgi:hypothetical protein
MIDFIGEDTRKKLDFNMDNNYGDLVLLVEETRASGKNYQPAGNISEAL